MGLRVFALLALTGCAAGTFLPVTAPPTVPPAGLFACNAAGALCPVAAAAADSLTLRLLKAGAGSSCGPVGNCFCYNSVSSNLACCNTGLYDTRTHKCCGNSVVVAKGTGRGNHCPCTSSNNDATTGLNSDCPSTEPKCCTQTKFAELPGTVGVCYSETSNDRCCNTGEIYDHGASQCCPINGVQSLDDDCRCEADADCAGNDVCCKQTSPAVTEEVFCSTFSNFPGLTTEAGIVGVGARNEQRCNGRCIDPEYQTCCNGNACAANFEKCCGSTCCNKFVGSCLEGERTRDFFDRNNLNMEWTTCSIVEAMNPKKVFWIFLLPTALLFATVFGAAVALAFAGKASDRVFMFVEKALIAVGILTVLAAAALFFSPLYKYGMLFAFAGLLAIITAAGKNKWLNILLIIVVVIALIYYFDPFHASNLLSAAPYRLWNSNSPNYGQTDYWSDGVLRNLIRMRPSETGGIPNWCTTFYDHFNIDANLQDDRLHNPMVETFGYCSRQWVMALLIVSGFLLIGLVLLFILAVIGLLIRFRKEMLPEVQLELVEHFE